MRGFGEGWGEVARLGQIISNMEATKEPVKLKLEEPGRSFVKAVRKNKIASRLFAKTATVVGNPDSPKDTVRNVGVLYEEMTNLRKQVERIPELESVVNGLKRETVDMETINERLKQRLAASSPKLLNAQSIERDRVIIQRS
jgi:hypothetical protein